mgnify:CR=1 FL=1
MCLGYADLSALNTGSSKKFNSPLFILPDQPDPIFSEITWSGSDLHFASRHNTMIDIVLCFWNGPIITKWMMILNKVD